MKHASSKTPGVFPVMARDGWPKNPDKTFRGRQGPSCSTWTAAVGIPIIQKETQGSCGKADGRRKVGFVNLPLTRSSIRKAHSDHILNWLGGLLRKPAFSTNPQLGSPTSRRCRNIRSPRGVKPFEIKDEWYFNIRFPSRIEGRHTDPDGGRRPEKRTQ